MRSHNFVNAFHGLRTLAAAARQIHLLNLRATLFIATFVIAGTVAVEAMADDPPKPVIVDFYISFDGIDQYYLSGRVEGVEDLNNMTVTFSDIVTGYTALTNPDGTFGLLFWLTHGENETFSATVMSHEGVESDRAMEWIY